MPVALVLGGGFAWPELCQGLRAGILVALWAGVTCARGPLPETRGTGLESVWALAVGGAQPVAGRRRPRGPTGAREETAPWVSGGQEGLWVPGAGGRDLKRASPLHVHPFFLPSEPL